MLPKPTQDERNANFKTLRDALKDYYKLLARDFNHASDAEDEEFLDSEMKRTWDFLRGLDENACTELHAWSETDGMVD